MRGPTDKRSRVFSPQCDRGAITLEYTVLVGTVGLVLAGALALLGPPLLSSYTHARDTIIWPMP